MTEEVLASKLVKEFDDLFIKAMLFDLQPDLEGLSLQDRATPEPRWLQDWRQKFSDSDYMAVDSGETCERR